MSAAAMPSRFALVERRTTVRRELLGGAATFLTMSYILFVNPAILSAAGLPFDAVAVATALAAAVTTLAMGLIANYPFARLSGPANVLIMPGLQSANISAKLLRELGGDAVIGPMLVGMEKSVQIAPMTSTASELVTLAVLAAGGIAR